MLSHIHCHKSKERTAVYYCRCSLVAEITRGTRNPKEANINRNREGDSETYTDTGNNSVRYSQDQQDTFDAIAPQVSHRRQQPINQSINHSVGQSVNQSID